MMVLVLMSLSMTVYAQIPAEVTDVLKKCEQKMQPPTGTYMEMDLHVKMALIFSMNGTVASYSKGEKSFTKITVKMMGKEISTEEGYDGTQEWEYKAKIKDDDVDSLIITRTSKKPDGEYDISLNLDKDYKKANMKVKDGKYEITFTEPKTKDTPKKTVLLINQKDYLLYELQSSMKGVSMRMTVKKVTFDVSDDVFVLDLKKYPGAKIIRK